MFLVPLLMAQRQYAIQGATLILRSGELADWNDPPWQDRRQFISLFASGTGTGEVAGPPSDIMKVEIPDKLKADVPQTAWGKIMTATPVVMAVVATMLAGLASSEMTKAQYDRALAAQQQSKAGDQWSFFQAKRLRGAYQRNTYEILQDLSGARPVRAASLPGQLASALGSAADQAGNAKSELSSLLESPAGKQSLAMLESGAPPDPGASPAFSPQVKAALEIIDSSKPEAEITPVIAAVSDKDLEQALTAAKDQASAFDDATKPSNASMDRIGDLLTRRLAALQPAPGSPDPAELAPLAAVKRDFTAASLRYAARRYEVEARLNQTIANLYEVQVRRGNLSAERHHHRSERFFFGMLAAQLGVIIGTFAIAARQRNLLWSLAAVAGLIAVAFAVYVYLCV
jgi:hypothetical protein